MISENLTQFFDKPVVEWEEGTAIVEGAAYRIRLSYDEADHLSWTDKFAAFLEDPNINRVEALVIGDWGGAAGGDASTPAVEAVAAARERLPSLNAIFLGDLISEECEISWMNHGDVSPLLEAYPALEHLTIRGGQSLSLGSPRHAKLRQLIIQAGGLAPSVMHEISTAELPALEHLELWLGEPNYGGDVTVEDLAPVLRGDRFPKLKYLGLKDSVIQDEIAEVIALAPITDRLDVLDLSMGTLSDEGAKALAKSPAIRKLKRLDIHHHFVSPDMVVALVALGIKVDFSERQEPQTWGGESHRFIAVSE